MADVAVELQNLAGSAVQFTAVADSHMPGVYKVAVEYHCEELGRASLKLGLRLLQAAVQGTPIDVRGEVNVLHLARAAPPPAPRPPPC